MGFAYTHFLSVPGMLGFLPVYDVHHRIRAIAKASTRLGPRRAAARLLSAKFH
jgi:hypothetical protein